MMNDADIALPLSTSSVPPASRCHPPFSARPTRASCISFAAATGRDEHSTKPRPATARPSMAHRQPTLNSLTQWQFLTKTPSGGIPPRPTSSRASRLRTRPATARAETTASSGTSVVSTVPRRPATCRGPRTHSAPASTALVLVDPCVIEKAARHETEQELYTGPLEGKSIEFQQPDMLSPKSCRDSCVVNAISLSEFHRSRAIHARAKGELERVISHLEKLLELIPNDHVALFELAIAYEKTGRLDDAQHTYQRLLPIDTNNPFLHYNIGNLEMKMDRVEDAIASYTTAIHKNGSGKCQNLAFYRQRGAAFRKHGEFEKAAQDYARVHAVHYQRKSLTNASTSPTSLGPFTRSNSEEWMDDEYTTDQMYSARHFAAQCTPRDQTTTSIDFLHHSRAMIIAAKPSHARTEEELWLLSDELARRFPCCATLDPEARKHLSTRVIAGANMPRGAILVKEGTQRGEYVFFIARGRVSVHKRSAPRVAVSFNENQMEESGLKDVKAHHTGDDTVVSWEMLRSTVFDDPTHSEDEKEEVFQSMTRNFPVIELESWRRGHGLTQQHQVLLSHLTMGDVCGRQGRFSHHQRLYSAVVSEQCDFFAVAWADFVEVERLHRLASSSQLARFLGTVPLFRGLPTEELVHLSKRARSFKVVGERVVCTEGQLVNGLLIIREGSLCQLYPSELSRPPDFSVAFNLSGSISMHDRDVEHGGRHFFAQLEHSDDPFLFIHDSAMMHGFLPHDFLPKALARLNKQLELMNTIRSDQGDQCDSEALSRRDTNAWHGAISLMRGAFFNASSSWIPPRKTRREDLFSVQSGGVSCAKSALITTESSELVFFTASDLRLGLSVQSRVLLQKNMQQINNRRFPPNCGAVLSDDRRPSLAPSPGMNDLRKLVFLKPPSGDDLLRKYVHESDWQNYKQELVSTIVADARQKRPHLFAGREFTSNGHSFAQPPVSARSHWKR